MAAYKLLLILQNTACHFVKYRITPEELEEINQLLEEMDKMEQ